MNKKEAWDYLTRICLITSYINNDMLFDAKRELKELENEFYQITQKTEEPKLVVELVTCPECGETFPVKEENIKMARREEQ